MKKRLSWREWLFGRPWEVFSAVIGGSRQCSRYLLTQIGTKQWGFPLSNYQTSFLFIIQPALSHFCKICTTDTWYTHLAAICAMAMNSNRNTLKLGFFPLNYSPFQFYISRIRTWKNVNSLGTVIKIFFCFEILVSNYLHVRQKMHGYGLNTRNTCWRIHWIH